MIRVTIKNNNILSSVYVDKYSNDGFIFREPVPYLEENDSGFIGVISQIEEEGETFYILEGLDSEGYIKSGQHITEIIGVPINDMEIIKISKNFEVVETENSKAEEDFYNYLNDKKLSTCSIAKFKTPDSVVCIPTSITASGRDQASDEKNYLTLSRNGGPKIVIITPDSTASEEDNINFINQQLKLLYFAQDEKSVAFISGDIIIGIEPKYDSEGNPIDFLTGISTNGFVNYVGTDYDIKNGIYDFNSLIKGQLIEINNPIIIPETNTITFYPTDNVLKELDRYYDFGGNDSREPVTIMSCAKVLSEEVTSQEEPYVFSFRNYDSFSSGIELRLDKRDNAPYRGSWSLKDNLTGDLIANSNGYATAGVDLNFSASDFYSAEISILQEGTSEREYALEGDMKLVVVTIVSKEENSYLGTDPEGILTIKRYNPNIFEYEFGANLCDLVVPDYLPENTTTMRYMFNGCKYFNQDISGWDTSRVTNMSGTFSFATSFNQNINSWDTSRVTDMSDMFEGATVYNQPLNNWNTANVIYLESMFNEAVAFNQNINSWDTSKVITMSGMFSGTLLFNQPLDAWNTSRVTSFSAMFASSKVFNNPLNTWDTSSAETMARMFYLAENFNKPLSNWNTSRVNRMFEMFYKATSFNQDLSSWDVSYFRIEPSDFALNTYNWTLPKPIWGSNGSV